MTDISTNTRLKRNTIVYLISWWIVLLVTEVEGLLGGLTLFAPKTVNLSPLPSPYFDFSVPLILIGFITFIGYQAKTKFPGKRFTKFVTIPGYLIMWVVITFLGLGWGVVAGASLCGYGVGSASALFGFLAIGLALGGTLFISGLERNSNQKGKRDTEQNGEEFLAKS